ncbi:hypothetical protein SAMN05216266_103355 [Amycolatopsis marina]|uniref:PPE family protein n=1 Tax=Amycolatopsis marina TaxID=490629 RepID=A0A1I0XQQ7_9PSEU|nr:hypothetical protein [Amycolatopsis marina]SFB02538.1 hypothetical protein SAMN05216266_103355 [Amycolatopsis marina]
MSMTGQQIYENFMIAPGTGGLSEAQMGLAKVMEEYTALADRIVKVAESLEEGWEGDASGAARRGAGPLAVEHARASEEMNTAQELLVRQIDSFVLARNSVTTVPPTPDAPSTMDNILTLGSAQNRYESQVAATQEAERRNVAVMSLWANHSSYNERMMPTSYGSALAPPAPVSVDAPRPGGSAVDGGRGGELRTTTPAADAAGTRASGVLSPPSGVQQQPVGAGGGTVVPPATPPAAAAHSGGATPNVTTPSGHLPSTNGGTEGERSTGVSGGSRSTGGPAVGRGVSGVGSGSTSGRLFSRGTGTGSGGGPGAGQNLGAGRGTGAVPPGATGGSTARHAGTPGTAGGRGMGGVPVVPGAGRGRNEESEDHQRKYGVESDDQFQLSEQGEKVIDPRTGLPTTPPVLGESRR